MRKKYLSRKTHSLVLKALNSKKARVKRVIIVLMMLFAVYVYGFGDYGLYRYFSLKEDADLLQAEVANL